MQKLNEGKTKEVEWKPKKKNCKPKDKENKLGKEKTKDKNQIQRERKRTDSQLRNEDTKSMVQKLIQVKTKERAKILDNYTNTNCKKSNHSSKDI